MAMLVYLLLILFTSVVLGQYQAFYTYTTSDCSGTPVRSSYSRSTGATPGALTSCAAQGGGEYAQTQVISSTSIANANTGYSTFIYSSQAECESESNPQYLSVISGCTSYSNPPTQAIKYSCTTSVSATRSFYSDLACSSLISSASIKVNPYATKCTLTGGGYYSLSCTGASPPPPGDNVTDGLSTDEAAATAVLLAVIFGFLALAAIIVTLQRRYKKTQLFEDFTRRIFAISPLLAVAYNTIASIYALGRGTVTNNLKSPDLPLRETMGFYSYSLEDYAQGYITIPSPYAPSGSGGFSFPVKTKFWAHQCPSLVSSLTLTCTYTDGPVFQYMVYGWVAFFVAFFVYRMSVLWSYSPDDLRFYIATQRLNGLNVNTVFRFLLFVLSAATFLVMIYYTFVAGVFSQSGGNTSSYVQAAVFLVVNLVASSNLSKIQYKMHVEYPCLFGLLKTRKLKSMTLFASPCPITLPDEERAWFGGVFLPHAKVFNILELAITKAGVGDTSALKALGDESLIKQYMEEITREEKKTDAKERQSVDAGAAKEKAEGKKLPIFAGPLKRIGALLPLTLLVLGIFNLIYGGLQNNQVYSPPASFFGVMMGGFTTDGSLVTVQSQTGDSFLKVPGDIRRANLDICLGAFGSEAGKFSTHIGGQVVCALEASYWMIALGALCLTFFVVWLWFRLTITLGFSAHDLRFLIATDRANNLYRNQILCAVGGTLAAVALLSIWYYRARVGNPPENYFLDLVNVSVIAFSLLSFSHGRYQFGEVNTLKGGQTSLEMTEDFPKECPITLEKASLTNLYGGLVSHASIFNAIEEAIRLAARGDSTKLEAFGEAELIKQYMAKLLSARAETSAKSMDNRVHPDSPTRGKPTPSVDPQPGSNSVVPTSGTTTDDVETPTTSIQ